MVGGAVTTGADSEAILTQSVGGGGGNGVLAVSSAVSLSTENTGGTLGIGVGGYGGEGGAGGDVHSTVTTTSLRPQIGTTGDNASAIVAQSIGGGGGRGGVSVTSSVSLAAEDSVAVGIGVGGFGGGGGDAGQVTLDVTGQVVTEGRNADGVVAQSIGGGGGKGGVNVTTAVSLVRTGTGGAASIGVGGFGGGGGKAGAVDLAFEGEIQAAGGDSYGILAQSVGGGGGRGGVNVSAGLSYASGDKGDGHALLIGVGGFGGAGGDGDRVGVTVNGGGRVLASGDERAAILAQSVGGGGGNGGVNVSGGIVSDAPIVLGFGGMGGAGGIAGDVGVDAHTDLVARGLRSGGIVAQSLGGGGGNGGLNVSGAIALSKDTGTASVTVGVGGFGGAGAISGDASIDHRGAVDVEGEWAHGLFAQSVAGGGGNGGLNVAGSINRTDTGTTGGSGGGSGSGGGGGSGGGSGGSSSSGQDLSIVAGFGGHGGAGADAGDADIVSTGDIGVAGDHARGVFAQSLGGGGGTGGINVAGVFTTKGSPLVLGVGGFGGGGGHAGAAKVTRGADDVFAGAVRTAGTGAHGIEVTSIGGGGGDAGANVVMGITLAGGDATDGEKPDGENPDDSEPGKTRPHPKHTGVDESVFVNYDKVLDELEGRKKPEPEKKPDDKKEDEGVFALQVAVGGDGGTAGHGGTATVFNHGDVFTSGRQSYGIMAQSIGGGGGNASLNLLLSYQGKSDKNFGANIGLGGGTGDGGHGDEVKVDHVGGIETQGADAFGILAQSVGGGGGNVGVDKSYSKGKGGKVDISLGRQGGTGGTGGKVTLNADGIVITRGEGSHGLLAQSVGNGGGNSSSRTRTVEVPEDEDNKQEASSVSMSVGLEGGAGGEAGEVKVGAAGWVVTEGDTAHAIFAQSVGGGGGNAGDADASISEAQGLALAIGGSGGVAGFGGKVTVETTAQIRTFGEGSIGVLAQSVGGGGGTGSTVKSEAKKVAGSAFSIAVGGNGGVGATGGDVTVDNGGTIVTAGRDAYGILAQSIGGGGGLASGVTNKLSNEDKDEKVVIGMTVGGIGGSGAVGGKVTVNNRGGVGTSGARSVGIFAQSIGGGGGNADKIVAESTSKKGAASQISRVVGGEGSVGGAAGDVAVNNLGAAHVVTFGDEAHGILAMSVGGGGGNASAISTSHKAEERGESSGTLSIAATFGGRGGTGGTGGKVDVFNEATIVTRGARAHGILGQSIGGGGGNGSTVAEGNQLLSASEDDAAMALSVGGRGGSGNAGGDVTVTNRGAIEVSGDRSYGIFAQSVGGGGGNGGSTVDLKPDANADFSDVTSPYRLDFGVGGLGGTGGDSGDVRVDHTGSIVVRGDHAYGIFAQSVSGGGGTMGSSVSSPLKGGLGLDLLMTLGRGSTGEVGTTTVRTAGDIVMLGANSRAFHAQSVNGGGGDLQLFLDVSRRAAALGEDSANPPDNPDFEEQVKARVKAFVGLGATKIAAASGSSFVVEHVGAMFATGDDSTGASTQSVGGGGGEGNLEITVDNEATAELELILGGTEASDSRGGDIAFNRTGDVMTAGERAGGANIQSVGGGGGSLRARVFALPPADSAAEPRLPPPGAGSGRSAAMAADTATEPMGDALATGLVSVGATASFGVDGGALDLAFEGDVVTQGAYSPGLVVQSIGGGGGSLALTGFADLQLALGGTGGTQGHGGAISLVNRGAIVSSGELSHGVVLQSIGGGGGAVLTDTPDAAIALALRADNSGNGGAIAFTQTGDVVTYGARSIALVAQSLAGGGGLVDRVFADTAGGAGTSSDVALRLDGSLIAAGAEGVGLFAQSRGADGQGDLDIVLAEGRTIYGGAGGTGLWMSGGANNRFENRGLVLTADGADGIAVRGTGGSDAIDNYGMIQGGVELGAGANAFVGHEGSVFAPGAAMNLGGPSGWFENRGVFLPGGEGRAARVDLDGSFRQTAAGATYAELDFATGQLDGVRAAGEVEVAGHAYVSLLNPNLAQAGRHASVLFGGALGTVDQGLTMTTPQSAVVVFAPLHTSADGLALEYAVDFVTPTLDANLIAVGSYFNRVQAAGSSPDLAGSVTTLVYEPTEADYRGSLAELMPDFFGEHQADFLRNNRHFADTMLGRQQAGAWEKFDGEGDGLWIKYDAESGRRGARGDFADFRQSTSRYATGGQKTYGDRLSIGVGLSIDDGSSEGKGGAWTADGTTRQVAFALKHRQGARRLAATLAYGRSTITSTRSVNLTAPAQATMRREMEMVGLLVRASHTFTRGRAYLRPAVDAGAARLVADNARESGAGAENLVLPSRYATFGWVAPRLEAGFERDLTARLRVRPYVNAGFVRHLGSGETEIAAGLEGAPATAEPMNVAVDLGQNAWEGKLGFEFLGLGGNLAVQLEYQMTTADRLRIDAGNIKFNYAF